MSYIVTIRREGPKGEHPPIEAAEFRSAVDADPAFEVKSFAGSEDLVARWTSTEGKAAADFVFSAADGTIHVNMPANEVLVRMQSLAREVAAGVFGEEGEELTEVPVSGESPPGQGCATSIILFLPAFATYFVD